MSPAEKQTILTYMYSPSWNSPSHYFISLRMCHTQCIDIPVLAVSRLFAHEPSYWPYLPVEFPVAQWSSISSSDQKNIGLTPVKKTHILFISIPLFHYCILIDIDGDNTWFAPFAVLCSRFHSFFLRRLLSAFHTGQLLCHKLNGRNKIFETQWSNYCVTVLRPFPLIKNITHAFLRGP